MVIIYALLVGSSRCILKMQVVGISACVALSRISRWKYERASSNRRTYRVTLEAEVSDIPFVLLKTTACEGIPRLRDFLLSDALMP